MSGLRIATVNWKPCRWPQRYSRWCLLVWLNKIGAQVHSELEADYWEIHWPPKAAR